jgi:pilus assembly protein TadC
MQENMQKQTYTSDLRLFLHYSILTFIGVEIMTYLLLYFKVEDRTKRVERVLPDMLQLLSSNIRVGMTPFQALKLAARKEFGPLEEEIRHATARSLGTESFAQTLLGMSKRIKSDMLERAMKLFGTAMHSGGHLAPLLEELAKDIGETQALKKELVTNTKTYSSFIMFTIVVGTPLLLAISIHFITVITGLQAQTSTATASFGLGFLGGKVAITVDFLIKVSIVMLTLTGLLAGMLLGVITEGKAKFGLKYAPIIIGGSLIAFVILRILVTRYVGTLF